MRAFWETVSAPPVGASYLPGLDISGRDGRTASSIRRSASAPLSAARPGFFTPRVPPPYLHPPGSRGALSYYETSPLKATLERLVDFDRINDGAMRFSVGAVNVRSGNFVYFDNTTHQIGPEHVMASGSLPPGFPATEIDGEHYWDGGLVSNTPLQWVLDNGPRQDTLAFQVDLVERAGRAAAQPDRDRSAPEGDPLFQPHPGRDRSVQTAAIAAPRRRQAAAQDPAGACCRRPRPSCSPREADEKVYNLIQLIYHARNYEGTSKDYEFSRRTMKEHWASGYNDAVRTLRHPEVLQRPKGLDGVFTFDLAVDGRD